MATSPRYPSLFQINTRVWLQRLSHEAGRQITLVDIDPQRSPASPNGVSIGSGC